MQTLAIISHKGGAGKTSSSVMLAEELAGRGYRVVLVDADRQRGAGLLLGIEQPTGSVQQTQHARLRYFCSAGVPLRELPQRAQELSGLFDVAVVDTPSLDDPLARGWIQVASHALMVIPVEPISMRTLGAAEATLGSVRKLNQGIEVIGLLPTMFDESESTQRTLMLELRSRQGDVLLPVSIPQDSGLAHRAEQKAERRTAPAPATLQAYAGAADFAIQKLRLESPAAAPAAAVPAAIGAPAAPASSNGAAVPPWSARRRPEAAPAPVAAPAAAVAAQSAAQPAAARPEPAAVAAPAAAAPAPAPMPAAAPAGGAKWTLLHTVIVVLAVAVAVLATVLFMRTPDAAVPAPGAGVQQPQNPAGAPAGQPK
ncbi:MAG: ParA family protein [Armatimonadota bacterium]